MGNTISGPSGAGQPPPVDAAHTGVLNRRRHADALHRQEAAATLRNERAVDAAATRGVFADAARLGDALRSGPPKVLEGRDSAARQPARFTISKVWENPAKIGPDVSGMPMSAPSILASPHTFQIGSGMDAILGVDYLVNPQIIEEDQRIVDHSAKLETKQAATSKEAIVPIPQAHIDKALAIAARLSVDNTVHVQDADGTYKVGTGPDAGQVRDLSSMIVGFTPRADVSIAEMDQAGREISTLLRQESVLAQMDSRPGTTGATLTATVTLAPSRTQEQEKALITALSSQFGGTTKIADDKVAVIVDFGGDVSQAVIARASAEAIVTQSAGAAHLEFKQSEARFPAGVRIANPEASKARFVDATRAEYQKRDVKGRSLESLTKRAEEAFDNTWQRLFGSGIRPAAQHYVMIDQKSRHLEDEDAPMHWSARAVSLNADRTEIVGLWTSELVLDTRNTKDHQRTLTEDPLIGRGQFRVGTALVKDVGLTSPSYAPLGTYVIPVKDAGVAIKQMKSAETESTAKLVKYHTEVPNCLSYALGLLKNAGPTELRHQSALDSVFRAQTRLDTQPLQGDPVPNLGEGDQFGPTIKGLVTGDTNYPRTLAFLDKISDETMSHPSEADWKKAFIDLAGSVEHDRLKAEADQRRGQGPQSSGSVLAGNILEQVADFKEGLNPSANEISAYRNKVNDDFNKGLRFEVTPDPKLTASGPRLSDLHNEVATHNLATLPRTKSAPNLS